MPHSSCASVMCPAPPCSSCHTVGRPCTTTCSGPTGVQRAWLEWQSSETASEVTLKGVCLYMSGYEQGLPKYDNTPPPPPPPRLPMKRLAHEAPFIYHVSFTLLDSVSSITVLPVIPLTARYRYRVIAWSFLSRTTTLNPTPLVTHHYICFLLKL